MRLKPCTSCGTPIGSRAKQCPACGQRWPHGYAMQASEPARVFLGCLFLIGVLMFACWGLTL